MRAIGWTICVHWKRSFPLFKFKLPKSYLKATLRHGLYYPNWVCQLSIKALLNKAAAKNTLLQWVPTILEESLKFLIHKKLMLERQLKNFWCDSDFTSKYMHTIWLLLLPVNISNAVLRILILGEFKHHLFSKFKSKLSYE